jgi:hypothetical protein
MLSLKGRVEFLIMRAMSLHVNRAPKTTLKGSNCRLLTLSAHIQTELEEFDIRLKVFL